MNRRTLDLLAIAGEQLVEFSNKATALMDNESMLARFELANDTLELERTFKMLRSSLRGDQ